MLVASDAVGMGLNLNINRIVFASMSKYDGGDGHSAGGGVEDTLLANKGITNHVSNVTKFEAEFEACTAELVELFKQRRPVAVAGSALQGPEGRQPMQLLAGNAGVDARRRRLLLGQESELVVPSEPRYARRVVRRGRFSRVVFARRAA